MSEQPVITPEQPTEVVIPEKKEEPTTHHDVRNIIISCLSKFISGYALNIINIVVEILEDIYGKELITNSAKGLMSSASLVGCVTGQLIIGFLGDYLGRKAALVITVVFNILGCIGSALAFPMGPINIVHALIFWRFVMGFGIGGTYPLSAVMGTESASEGKKEWTGAFVFTFHGLGWFVSPALAYVLLAIWPDGKEYIWRILLFISAIPAIIIACIRSSETGVVMKDQSKDSEKPSIWKLLLRKDIAKKMVGTGGAWFIFDINLYGQALFSTMVVDLIFDKADPTVQAEMMSLFNLLGYVGCLISIVAVNWWGIKILQIQGFFCRSVLFVIMGVCLTTKFMNAPILLVLYSIIFFYGNFGPNTTTFLLPAVTYEVEVRSTLNGVSAAMGKLGASIGAYAYEAIAKYVGEDVVMYIAGVLALIAGLLTMFFIPREVDNEIFEKKLQKKLQKEQEKQLKQSLLEKEAETTVEAPTLA